MRTSITLARTAVATRLRQHRCALAQRRRVVRLFTLALLVVGLPAFADLEAERFQRLTPAQQAQAQFLKDFVARIDAHAFARVGELNGGVVFDERSGDTEYNEYASRVTKGPVVEKAGGRVSIGKKTAPGRADGVLIWSLFYTLDIHPMTPLVGHLHATIVMQIFEDGTASTGGWVGVMPGARVEQDLADLKQLTDAYFAARDKDPTLYRKLICKGTDDTVPEFRRHPACSGVSFYGPPVYRDSSDRSIRFIAGIYEEFLDAYLNQIALRADDPFTEADVVAQEDMRRRWLIDQLFSDPYATKVTPFEVWTFQNAPPEIRF